MVESKEQKIEKVRGLLANTITEISQDGQSWGKFLDCANKFYKYPFKEQVLIFAQRPTATACAPYDLWNNHFDRFIKKGTKGISLLTASNDKIRHVFDIVDTKNKRENAPEIKLWSFDDKEHRGLLQKTFSEMRLPKSPKSFITLISEIADNYVEVENLQNVPDEGKKLASQSISYMIAQRCDLADQSYIDYSLNYFDAIANLSQPDFLSIASTVADASASILRRIENSIKNERSIGDGREQNNNRENGNELQARRGLPHFGSRRGGSSETETIRAMGEREGEILEGTSEGRILPPRLSVDIERSLSGGGYESQRNVGDTDIPHVGERSSSGQEHANDGMGGPHEPGKKSSRGKSIPRGDIPGSLHNERITASRNNEHTAEEGIKTSSATGQLSLFPTEEEQKLSIEKQISLSQEQSPSKNEPDHHLSSLSDDEIKLYLSKSRFLAAENIILYKVAAENEKYSDLSSNDQYNFRSAAYDHSYIGRNLAAIHVETDNEGVVFAKEGMAREFKTWDELYTIFRTEVLEGQYFSKEAINRVHDQYADIVDFLDSNCAPPWPTEETPAAMAKNLRRMFKSNDIKETILETGEKVISAQSDNGISLEFDLESGKTEERFYSWHEAAAAFHFIKSQGHIQEQTIDAAVTTGDNNSHMQKQPVERTAAPLSPSINYIVTDPSRIGQGTPSEKAKNNVAAIRLLKDLQSNQAKATSEQQEVLARYVGWGGLANVFDEKNVTGWQAATREELKELLSDKEYRAARASTLTAFYTPLAVIQGIYGGLRQMGFRGGNILEPAMGTGNFYGLLPDDMSAKSNLYGVELDKITGQISQQLFQKADIAVCGFEEASFPNNFFDAAVGNVPFGNFKVSDKDYDKHKLVIHDYFFAKTLDKVRPGGVIAFVTSKGTLDKANPTVRKYLAQRAELLGAVRLPNDTMLSNAGTEVTSDILFLQKRERQIDIVPDWVHTGEDSNGIPMNQYFVDNPQMILGRMVKEKSMYGSENETACIPEPGLNLEEAIADRIKNYIHGNIKQLRMSKTETKNNPTATPEATLPADPTVRNYSYTTVNGEVYFREDSIMKRKENDFSPENIKRIKGLIEIRDFTREVIDLQLTNDSDENINRAQQNLSLAYDKFSETFGCINDKINAKAFDDDSSYYLICGLEKIDEEGNFLAKADLFSKRTIRGKNVPEHVETAMEALILSVTEKAGVDLDYMSYLTGLEKDKIIKDLTGEIYQNPAKYHIDGSDNSWETRDEYLSGNILEKLASAKAAAAKSLDIEMFVGNIDALEKVLPEEIPAAEINVRLGATWIDPKYINQFITETLDPAFYSRIEAKYISFDSSWVINNKTKDSLENTAAHVTYGTPRVNAYEILEETLNLKEVRVYTNKLDPITGKDKRELDPEATALAQQKQDALKEYFKDWIFKEPERRQELTKTYNEKFNNTRPREYDGSNMSFYGMNPEIELHKHQKDAIARIVFGGNTLLAHEVGAGKTYEMIAGIMESKRLGAIQKAMMVVPNHLTEQTATSFLNLYPSANILVTRKKDFELKNRKKFCSQIATGEYDAVIMGFSQFEKIPISKERQERLLTDQIDEITDGISEMKNQRQERTTIKRMERTRKTLETKLALLNDQSKKDDVVTFEQLGVDKLVVDEAHYYKNLYYYTKMNNVAGLAQSEAKKCTDFYLKSRYMNEITNNKGIIFATGTPITNSMSEMYTHMTYLQSDVLAKMGVRTFDSWASNFGETVVASEFAPEGKGYRVKTRFARFYNLPELMNVFKEAADIKTADQLNLPNPEAEYHTVAVEPTDYQRLLMEDLSHRATQVHHRNVPPEEDNMLKITTDGRKIGLDQRLYDPELPDQPGTKVNVCVDNVSKIWEDGKDKRLTQLVFCDFSTPSKDKFNLYDDVKNKLIAKGIPANEIEFIHNADTEQKKKELFAKVQSGHVRVLMGSTAKMGAGTNIQERLVALHDLDCPWRPADLEQRAGRIVRPKNTNEKVDIYRYVTKDTFDAYLYQTLEHKQKFISQVMTSKVPQRSCEDVDESVLKYAEIKALCAGDPRIKEKMDLDIKVAKLRLAKNSYVNTRYALEDNLLKKLPEAIKECEHKIICLETDLVTRNENTNEENDENFSGMHIGDKFATKKESAGKALLEATEKVKAGSLLPIGQYKGFDMWMGYSPHNKYFYVELQNPTGMRHQTGLGTDVYGNITRINNCLNGIDLELETNRLRLDEHKKELLRCEEELMKPFQQEEELKNATARLAVVDSELRLDTARPQDLTPSTGQHKQVLEKDPNESLRKAAVPTEEKSINDTLQENREQRKRTQEAEAKVHMSVSEDVPAHKIEDIKKFLRSPKQSEINIYPAKTHIAGLPYVGKVEYVDEKENIIVQQTKVNNFVVHKLAALSNPIPKQGENLRIEYGAKKTITVKKIPENVKSRFSPMR